MQFGIKLEHCKLHNNARHSIKCAIINVLKPFRTAYCRIFCPKCLTLSNQMSHYKFKCIRMGILHAFFTLLLKKSNARLLFHVSILQKKTELTPSRCFTWNRNCNVSQNSLTFYSMIASFDAFEILCIWKYNGKSSICSYEQMLDFP